MGAISEADHANSILAAGRADLCAVARPHLANPAWTLTEAAKIGYRPVAAVPVPVGQGPDGSELRARKSAAVGQRGSVLSHDTHISARHRA